MCDLRQTKEGYKLEILKISSVSSSPLTLYLNKDGFIQRYVVGHFKHCAYHNLNILVDSKQNSEYNYIVNIL